ncbi:MAG TPA: tetratricopeptide repeat protein [Thermoanaerobaculia bacterium]|nr:tetratricopeptide repeat protein [Thermoanaerobaculia bacterium]
MSTEAGKVALSTGETQSAVVLKTVLISDLVDSTRLVEQLGDRRAAELFRRHDQLARALLARYQGREIDKTDGFLMLFDRPIEAVEYALAYHEMLAGLAQETGLSLSARVGIHFGEVLLHNNEAEDVIRGAKPLEVEGLAKPMAARLMGMARAGQILLTRGAFDLARRGEIGTARRHALRWLSHDHYLLKGVSEPVEIFEVGVEGTAPLEPPPDSEKAQRGARIPTILVLPFDDLSPDRDSSYFSEGLTDEIITDLSGLAALRVISRTSAMQLKGSQKDIRSIGRELKVQYVLEGSVRRSGDQIRISAKLADTATCELLWAERFKGDFEDVFEIQENISRTIVKSLALKLSHRDDQRLARRRFANIQAYDYYLRAKQEVLHFTEPGLHRALTYLQAAADLEGENVPLISAMGHVYWQFVNAGISTDPAYLDKAQACAERILALDPESPHGHRLSGMVGSTGGRVPPAEVAGHLRRALNRDPNDTDTLFWLSTLYGFMGHASEAAPLVERLLKIDPLTPMHHLLPGLLALMDGRFEQAGDALQKAQAMEPQNPMIRLLRAQALAMSRRSGEAVAIFEEIQQESPESLFGRLAQVYALALRQQKAEALSCITDDLAEMVRSDFQYSWSLAQCYAVLGEAERALEWLSNAVAKGLSNYPLLAKLDPLLESLRGDSGFAQLLGDVKGTWQPFDAVAS